MSESESTNATEETPETPEETVEETSETTTRRKPLKGKPGVPRNLRARSRKYAKRIGKRGTNEPEVSRAVSRNMPRQLDIFPRFRSLVVFTSDPPIHDQG